MKDKLKNIFKSTKQTVAGAVIAIVVIASCSYAYAAISDNDSTSTEESSSTIEESSTLVAEETTTNIEESSTVEETTVEQSASEAVTQETTTSALETTTVTQETTLAVLYPNIDYRSAYAEGGEYYYITTDTVAYDSYYGNNALFTIPSGTECTPLGGCSSTGYAYISCSYGNCYVPMSNIEMANSTWSN